MHSFLKSDKSSKNQYYGLNKSKTASILKGRNRRDIYIYGKVFLDFCNCFPRSSLLRERRRSVFFHKNAELPKVDIHLPNQDLWLAERR